MSRARASGNVKKSSAAVGGFAPKKSAETAFDA